MGLLKKNIDTNEIAKNLMAQFDDSNLTMQEKAAGVIHAMKELGITPSSKTRRQVTWIQLIFIIGCYIASAILFSLDPELSRYIKEIPKEYGSNGVIQAINALFYTGYYLTKTVSPMMQERLEKRKQEREEKRSEHELKIKEQEQKHELSMSRKEERIARRKAKRDRRNEI